MLIFINSNTDSQPQDTSHKFSVYFSNPIELPTNHNKIAVKQVEIPNTAHQFKESNSMLWIATYDQMVNVHMAYGVYIDPTKFYNSLDDVVAQMNGSQNKSFLTQYGLDVTFSVVNNKIAITNNASSTVDNVRVMSSNVYEPTYNGTLRTVFGDYFNVNGTPVFNEANGKLGFTGDLRTATIGKGQTYIAQSLPRLIRTNCFYLSTNITDNINTTGNPYKQPNILAKVPVTSNFGSLISFTEEQPDFFRISDNSIDFINFSILDDDLEECDLNNAPVTITLEIRTE